jgi:hypothetical protein
MGRPTALLQKDRGYFQTTIHEDLKSLADDGFFEVNHFLSILYGTMVRFYNTVVRW